MKKFALLLILSFYVTLPVQAQEQQTFVPTGINWDNTAARTSRVLQQRSLSSSNAIPAGIVNVSIVHPDYLDPNQFGLLISKANSITDCHDYSSLEYQAKYIENYYMDIDVSHYRRTLNETQNPEFDCDKKSKIISGLIILSADELKRKNVRQIRFSNGNARDTYNVSVTQNAVRLTPESMIAFKAQNLQGPDKTYIQYNFVDKSLLTLQVPMAEKGEDITQAVRNLASKSALQPVLDRAGLDTSGTNNVFYFTDPNNRAAERIGADGYAEFGTINVMRPHDGPNGRTAMPTPLKVFLTRPNVTL